MKICRSILSKDVDVKLEKHLAKKLKVNNGKLRGVDDGLNSLLEVISSPVEHSVDSADVNKISDEDSKGHISRKKSTKKIRTSESSVKVLEHNLTGVSSGGQAEATSSVFGVMKKESQINVLGSDGNTKHVVPAIRSCIKNETEELSLIKRRVRGLLNKLSESNIEMITNEMSKVFLMSSRSVVCQIFNEEVLASCSEGPRGSEQYAASFAAFIAGLACMIGIDFSAKLFASLAQCFEGEYLKEDGLSLRNLTLLICHLFIFGVCASDLIYDFLFMLSKRLTELDVTVILTVLQCCGMKLRGDDPTTMKCFIVCIQNKVSQLRSSVGSGVSGQLNMSSKRMEFMLDTICDIKNNKRRVKGDPSSHVRIKKWLQKSRVNDVLLRGLKWTKLLDPKKKGQWWLSGDVSTTNNIQEVASLTDRDVIEVHRLLHLATEQRMNTDARRAIFCVVMSGEDYIDAFEKILRLDLTGKQDREIMRVLVECCLQEKVFNKYYVLLASKLCSHDRNHKFTLQYCLWDHFKDLESMELLRLMNLARFVTEMLASFSISLAVLKSVDLSNPNQLSPRRIMYFRMLFEFIFEKSDDLVRNILTRIAAAVELESLRNDLQFFLKQYVFSTKKSLAGKFKIVKSAFMES